MRARRIAFVAPGRAELEEYELPAVTPGSVLLESDCTLISPGTERDCLLGRAGGAFPKYLGYSGVARVLETGEGSRLHAGDRVVVYHGIHASHLVKQESDLIRIENDALPSASAVFSVVAAMGLQGLRRTRPEFGESVMVMGLGLLGLFALQCARLSGALPLIALDGNPIRRKLAAELGADLALSPEDSDWADRVREATRGGAAVVLEVTGSPEAVNQGLRCMAPGGRIALVGCSRTPTREVDFYRDVHRPGITIYGAHNMARPQEDCRPGCWTMRADVSLLLRAFAAGRVRTALLVTDDLKPEQAAETFRRLAEGDASMLGAVFHWKKNWEKNREGKR